MKQLVTGGGRLQEVATMRELTRPFKIMNDMNIQPMSFIILERKNKSKYNFIVISIITSLLFQ